MKRNTAGSYTLIRSRRKTLAIHIKPDAQSPNGSRVEIRAPLQLPLAKIERFIATKSAWIAKQQAQIAARKPAAPRELPPSQYADGEFESAVRRLVHDWEQRLGVRVTFVGIRKMSSRWGSCTPKTHRIRLNAALAYCPRECLEYVVVHELAHLLENNHSPRFWAILARTLPDYKTRRSRLRSLQWVLDALTKMEPTNGAELDPTYESS